MVYARIVEIPVTRYGEVDDSTVANVKPNRIRELVDVADRNVRSDRALRLDVDIVRLVEVEVGNDQPADRVVGALMRIMQQSVQIDEVARVHIGEGSATGADAEDVIGHLARHRPARFVEADDDIAFAEQQRKEVRGVVRSDAVELEGAATLDPLVAKAAEQRETLIQAMLKRQFHIQALGLDVAFHVLGDDVLGGEALDRDVLFEGLESPERAVGLAIKR